METGMHAKIGILGGTFNPVHIGHLMVAQSAFEQLELAKVLFLPCLAPPHKKTTELADNRHRMSMLESAVEGDFRFEISDIEIKRGGISYTIDTISQLKKLNPGTDFIFIIGADTLTELHLWKNIHELFKMCRFVTYVRPGFDLESVRKKELHLDPPWPERLLGDIRAGELVDVSSSGIRHRIAEGLSIRYLVPASVEMYIAEHGLYRK